MQYVIKVSGEVKNVQDKAYVVDSKTAEEAKKIAADNFRADFSIDGDVITQEPRKRTKTAILALVLMTIPILLSLIHWKNGHDSISISPDLISCLYGVVIYAAFVVRFKGVQRTINSWIDILFAVVASLLLATFIKTILFQEELNLFGLFKINVNTNVVLIVAMILSWMGLKTVSLVCMGIVVIFALGNITALNSAMGAIWGPVFVLCSFIGIVSYIAVEPAFMESKYYLKGITHKGINYVKNDLSQAKTNISNGVNNLSEQKDNFKD